MRDADNTPRTRFSDGARRHAASGEAGGPGAHAVNERAHRRLSDSAETLRTVPRQGGRDEEEPGYVIHLPIRVLDLASATALANRLASSLGSLGFLAELDAGETTVSTADDQNNRHRVFCDLPLPDRSRCPQHYDHSGPCGEVPATPEQRPATGP